jgi:chaperonin GroEL
MIGQKTKELKFDNDVSDAILEGASKLAKAVSSTLGPKGNCVAIQMTDAKPSITKDGVTVAKHIKFKDNFENMGAELIKDVASRTADVAGDGTTTATVLAEAIYRRGLKSISAGANATSVKRGMDKAVKMIVNELANISTPIDTVDKFEQVATISANGDVTIGKLIAEAIDSVGAEGLITAETSNTTDTHLVKVEGMSLVNGYIATQFANQSDMSCVLEDCHVLAYNHKIENANDIIPLLNQVVANGNKPLLIIAEDVTQDALSTIIYNKINGGLRICAVKAPGHGPFRKDYLDDIAKLTGGTCISEELGIPLSAVSMEHLGQCGKVKVTREKTMIIDGSGDPADIKSYIGGLKEQADSGLDNASIGRIKTRISKLSDGVAIIKIAAMTQAELGEIRDRVEDAICATRAAVAEGIIQGGGTVLARFSDITLDGEYSEDEKIGFEVILDACKVPLIKIAENAGVNGELILSKVLEQDINIGYNAYTGEFVDMIEAGIIDPVKVTRTALQNAASIAGLLLTTNCMIAFDEDAIDAPHSMLDPTMGMMG